MIRNKIAGIVVEPLKDVFKMLTYNYRKHPQVTKVNVAMHNSEKSIIMYRVDPKRSSSLPNYSKALASFDKDHHSRSGTPSESIISIEVPCMTLQELIDMYNVTEVDLLQIDTEGCDYEIIKMIDFSRIRQKIIRFEHGAPDIMSWHDLRQCSKYLIEQGYIMYLEPHDAVACLRE